MNHSSWAQASVAISAALLFFVFFTPSISHAEGYLQVVPVGVTSHRISVTETPAYLALLNKLRVLIIKAQAAGMAIPISLRYAAGQDIHNSTDFSLDLKIGDTGAEVIALQNFLISKKYTLTASGTFDADTQTALMAYQTEHKIKPADGTFGESTRAYIRAHAK